jgi:hypothetical protein
MVAIANQQTSLVKYLSLNGSEITVGASSFRRTSVLNVNDITTDSGRIKRYYKKNKRSLSVSYSYIASSSEKTVDGREGRDFIFNLAMNSPRVLVNYKDDPTGVDNEFYGFITNYRDSIIRRDIITQCTYYSVDFEIEEQ